MSCDPLRGGVVPEEETTANRMRQGDGGNPPQPLLTTPSAVAAASSAGAATTTAPRAAAEDDADCADAEADAAMSTLLLLSSLIGFLGMRSLRARLISLAFAACCVLSLVCALVHRRQSQRRRRWRQQGGGAASFLSPPSSSSSSSCSRRQRRRRGALAVAFRLVFAAACNAVVAGRREFPTVVDSWPEFLAGRTAPILAALLGLTARLDSRLAAAALAAAQVAIYYGSQRAACEAVLAGFGGIGSYYLRSQAFFDEALDSGAWLISAVAGSGGGGGGGVGGVGGVGAPASDPSSSSSSSPPRSSSSSCLLPLPPSELEARACVAVMTEFQVIAALLLVAFGTKRPKRREEEEGEEAEDGPAPQRGRGSSSSGRSRRGLFHSWASFLIASAGLLRVAWTLLRIGGWERGLCGAGGFGGSGSGSGGPPDWTSSDGGGGGGGSGDVLGSEEPSLANKFRIVFARGVFAP